MTEIILVYLFFASCMFLAAYTEFNNALLFELLTLSLLWPWFLVICLFQRVIK